ncbi:YwqG family protein [Aureispira anguillae]|uniref:YwqG family protein n=1 Tax=Aureispira anguillae TaxID=2864201 RepID=A0A916DQ29_9BACT|nr:YwqG family protein [Aureispira anguillae]BDS10491.1 YwqG family protein [Aureispira anguillae]
MLHKEYEKTISDHFQNELLVKLLIEQLRPKVYLSLLESGNSRLFLSRIGGTPIVPKGKKSFIESQGNSMSFIGLLNCADLSKYHDELLFPSEGYLMFYCDLKDMESQIVFYEKDKNNLIAFTPVSDESILLENEIVFKQGMSIPPFGSDVYKKEIEIPAYEKGIDIDMIQYMDLERELSGGTDHNILGLPYGLQQDPSYFWAANYLDSDEEIIIEKERNEFYLLLQVNIADDTLGLDIDRVEAMLYFGIHKKDLIQKKFSNTLLVHQI